MGTPSPAVVGIALSYEPKAIPRFEPGIGSIGAQFTGASRLIEKNGPKIKGFEQVTNCSRWAKSHRTLAREN